MAEQNNIVLKILADVAGANASFKQMQKALADLSSGALSLGKNFNVFQKGVKGSIGAQKAAEAVSKQYLATMRQRLNISKAEVASIRAVTEMHKAEAAAMQAKVALMNAELAADNVALKEMQQELALRKLAIQEIELENRARRALTASKATDAAVTGDVADETQNVAHATGSASFALLSLGQAFQDSAQFGMGFAQGLRAINNNIQQVFTAIALGSVQAGGFGKFLRQMRGQLIGAGGLIIAFSALSAAMEFFANRAQKARKEAKELDDVLGDVAGGIFQQVGGGEAIFGDPEVLRSALGDIRDQIDGYKEAIESARESVGFGSLTAEMLAAIDVQRNNLELLEAQEEALKDIVAREELRQKLLAVSSGLNTVQELNTEYERFLASARAINPEVELTLEQFAKMSQEGSLRRFLANEQWEKTERHLREIRKESEDLAKAWSKILGPDGRMTVADRATPLPRGEDGLVRGPDSLSMSDGMRAFIEDHEAFREAQDRVIDSNQRFRESFAQMGTDLIVSFATIGGGMDGLQRTFGRFMTKYGAELVKMGLATILLGKSLAGVRAALKNLNPVIAIAAGAALVAAGSRLRAQGRSSAASLSGGGSGGMGSAPAYFTSGAGSSVFTGGNGVSSSLFPQPGLGTGGGNPITLPGLLSGGYGGNRSMRIQLVASGRDLVGAVDSELIASGRSSAGSPFVSVGAGVITGGSRGDFDGLI